MVTNMHFQTIEQKNNINIYTYIYLYNVISNRRPTVTEKRCREGGGETERDSVYMGDPAFFFFQVLSGMTGLVFSIPTHV